MKINELEKTLGLSKANIRYYESEGLIHPNRTDNGYRDYTEKEVQILKKIVIMRKLGLSIATIKDVLSNTVSLHKALEENETALNSNLIELVNMIDLNETLLKENNSEVFDVDYYWEQINNEPNLNDSFTKHDKFTKWGQISSYILLSMVCLAPMGHMILDCLNHQKIPLTTIVASIVGVAVAVVFMLELKK